MWVTAYCVCRFIYSGGSWCFGFQPDIPVTKCHLLNVQLCFSVAQSRVVKILTYFSLSLHWYFLCLHFHGSRCWWLAVRRPKYLSLSSSRGWAPGSWVNEAFKFLFGPNLASSSRICPWEVISLPLNDLVCVSIMTARSPLIALITLILAAGYTQKLPARTALVPCLALMWLLMLTWSTFSYHIHPYQSTA